MRWGVIILFFLLVSFAQDTTRSAYDNIKIYPNPCDDYFYICSPDTILPPTVKLFDMSGKLVLMEHIKDKQNEVLIDASRLKSGVYIIILEKND